MATTLKCPKKQSKKRPANRPANLEMRATKLLEQPFRYFHHPSFDTPKGRKEVMGDMPGLEKFLQERQRIQAMRNGTIFPEMRPCYEEPLLTREQEFHLFRKMNYLKYRAKKLMANMNPKRVGEKRVAQIEAYFAQATEVRNQIASSNFRLATQLLRGQLSFHRQHSLTGSLLSDAYLDVVKAIDYFDYNRGNKFSTYCTWVLRKNFARDLQTQARYQERYTTGLDDLMTEMEAGDDGYRAEIEDANRKKMVKRLLRLLRNSGGNGDVRRQIHAIENWFGLNGKDRRTLESISQEVGVTKERIRQLKEKGLATIRARVEELGLVYDED